MLVKAFKALFADEKGGSDQLEEHSLALAAAALLYEVARADFTQDAEEEARLSTALKSAFALTEEELEQIQSVASDKVDESTSLYDFTRALNDSATPEEKVKVIELMWDVAYADGEISKYEEHLIRRVAELIYVSHSDFMRMKHEVRARLN
jgi:uncharacterized tellurite resistance protein B-like protein